MLGQNLEEDVEREKEHKGGYKFEEDKLDKRRQMLQSQMLQEQREKRLGMLARKKRILRETITEQPSVDDMQATVARSCAAVKTTHSCTEFLDALRALRKMICRPDPDQLIELIIEHDIAPAVVPFLYEQNMYARFGNDVRTCTEQIVIEIGWILTNIACGTSKQTLHVTDNSGIEALAHVVVSSSSPAVIEQAVWGLGNIVGDGDAHRKRVLRDHALLRKIQLVARTYANNPEADSLVRTITWMLGNASRENDNEHEDYIRESLELVMRTLEELMQIRDKQIQTDILWAIGYIGNRNYSYDILGENIVVYAIDMLKQGITEFYPPCLRIVGNIISGCDDQTEKILEMDILPLLKNIFFAGVPGEEEKTVYNQKEIAWIMANIAGGTASQIKRLYEASCIYDIAVPGLAAGTDVSVRIECSYMLENAVSLHADALLTQDVEALFSVFDPVAHVLGVYTEYTRDHAVVVGLATVLMVGIDILQYYYDMLCKRGEEQHLFRPEIVDMLRGVCEEQELDAKHKRSAYRLLNSLDFRI